MEQVQLSVALVMVAGVIIALIVVISPTNISISFTFGSSLKEDKVGSTITLQLAVILFAPGLPFSSVTGRLTVTFTVFPSVFFLPVTVTIEPVAGSIVTHPVSSLDQTMSSAL